jgi:hypothetical protein
MQFWGKIFMAHTKALKKRQIEERYCVQQQKIQSHWKLKKKHVFKSNYQKLKTMSTNLRWKKYMHEFFPREKCKKHLLSSPLPES